MRLDVVHADPGDAARQREPLRELDPDEERSHEARPQRDRDRVDLVDGKPSGFEGLLDDARKQCDVGARRQLRNHAAVLHMDVLCGHDVSEDASVLDDGRPGVVAGGLDPENSHDGIVRSLEGPGPVYP